MKKENKELLQKIREHLADLHERWQNDKNCDGHCKMSEGFIELRASYPNWFDAGGNKKDYLSAEPEISIGVYSYLFGPSRMHDFSSLEEAWQEIKKWNYQEENNEYFN
jgi:hypothetical protein